MKLDKRRLSAYLLGLGLLCLVIGLATDLTVFSWGAVGCVVLSLLLGGRWLRPRRLPRGRR